MKTSKLWSYLAFSYIVLMILFFSTLSARSKSVVKTFEDPRKYAIKLNNHLVVHKDSGILYLGSINRIYQLDPNLNVIAVKTTGPHNDSTECISYQRCPSNVTISLTDTVNKALVIDYSRANLIACGSTYQGSCHVISMANISTSDFPIIQGPIVANDKISTTVAFIAPGPPIPFNTTVLYVGVSYTGISPSQHKVPAVSSRSLNPQDNFRIIKTLGSSDAKIVVSQLNSYAVNYVYGFSSQGFSYFLTTQKKETGNSSFVSKIVRVCQNDSNYYSYTEIPIVCLSQYTRRPVPLVQAAFVGNPGSDLATELNITQQDDVLFTVFSESHAFDANLNFNYSSLCAYSLKQIRYRFHENIAMCFKGQGKKGLGFIETSTPCVSTNTEITENFCGLDVNTPLLGEIHPLAISMLDFKTQISSIAADSADNFSVVFLGTKNGHLKKVFVERLFSGTEYDDLEIESGSTVLSDMLFDTQKTHLYVMTETTISKVLLHNCSTYLTCNDCIDAKDPYCGWCPYQNWCTLKNNCLKNAELSLNWIHYKTGQCARITIVRPHQSQISTTRTITVNIDHLPTRSSNFSCVFGFANGNGLTTIANLTSNGVVCYTPHSIHLPKITQKQHHFTASLSVQMLLFDIDFVTTNFVFYDCNIYNLCTSCVTTEFSCTWCIEKQRCKHDIGENCRTDILVTGLNRVGPSIRTGPAFCPRIMFTAGIPELLLPYSSQKTIQVKMDNILQTIVMQDKFSCRFRVEGYEMSSNAQLRHNTIYCDPTAFKFTSDAPIMKVSLDVIWGDNKTLDNPDKIHLLVYRCALLADNCGMCHVMDAKYGCGWCNGSNRCELREQCNNGLEIWLNRKQTCPNPEIHSFYPTNGPWEGGTNFTIEGINLGKTFEDIYSGVTVAGVPCEPYRHLYSKTRKIVCRLDEINNLLSREGPVIVIVESFRGESTKSFRFVNPKITKISPTMGAMNGGTRVSIFGEHLDTGSDVQAFVGNIPCQIILKELNRLECRTGSFDHKHKLNFVIRFDGKDRIYEPGFRYVENPVITFKQEKPVRIFSAGGISVAIQGSNFDVIQDPKLYVVFNEFMFTSPCNISNKNEMHCITPIIPNGHFNFNEKAEKYIGIPLPCGFILDTINYTATNGQPFLLFPNPKVDFFENGVKIYEDDHLTINGQNLNYVVDERDFVVTIGNKICNVSFLSMNQLTCKLSSMQPMEIDDNQKANTMGLSNVTVKIGHHLIYNIGKLEIRFPEKKTWTWQIILITVFSLCIFVGCVVLAVYFIRKYKRET